MKIYEIIGVQEHSGVIRSTGKEWTNYELFCAVENDRTLKGLTGRTIETVKVSKSLFEILVNEVGSDFIGVRCNFEFEKRTFNGVDKIVTSDIVIY